MSEGYKIIVYVVAILVVIVLLTGFISVFFFETKLVRDVCKMGLSALVEALMGDSIFTGITKAGVMSGCGIIPF